MDGTLIEAWASLKSFRRKDENPEERPPPDDPGNPTVDFHGEKRSNAPAGGAASFKKLQPRIAPPRTRWGGLTAGGRTPRYAFPQPVKEQRLFCQRRVVKAQSN